MNFKKLSITCLSMLFSIVPICSSAMEENFIGSETIYELPYIEIHDLLRVGSDRNKDIVNALVRYFSGYNCFVYNGFDENAFNKLVDMYLENRFHNNLCRKLHAGTICVYNYDPENPKVEDQFDLDISKMVIKVGSAAKLIVIEDENLAKQFERALEEHNKILSK